MGQIIEANEDIRHLLDTVVKNQLHHEINAEKLHRNTRVMLYEAITEDTNGSTKKRVVGGK